MLFSIVAAPILYTFPPSVPFFPHHHQTLYFVFDNSLPNKCKVISPCGIYCISLMISNIKYLSMYLLPVFYVSFGKMSIQFLNLFFNLSLFLLMSCMNFFCILDINSFPDICLAGFFFHSVGCLFILLVVLFAVEKVFSLM